MKKFIALKSGPFNLKGIPGLGQDMAGTLYIAQGESILVPDDSVITNKYLEEAKVNPADLKRGRNHLSVHETTCTY